MNKTFEFSTKNRAQFIGESAGKTYDLLVIGGGVTGAGIALDAVSRGLSVALIEKKDYAWGTSSRSTKLIHGGLRYLKQLELGLVKEVGTERAIVHNNAKNLVIPEKMLLPIVKNGSLGYYSTSAALVVYDFLAGVKNKEKRKMLNKQKTLKAEPLLDAKIVEGGGLYYEYRSDDARLTIEIIKKAVELGAHCINYAEFVKPIYENHQFKGASVLNHIDGTHFNLKAKQVVNAAGPWVDLIRKKDNSIKSKRLQLTKGVHLVFPYDLLPIKQAVYFDVEEDNRMLFAIPRNNKTYVGTTDTVYNQDIDEPTCSAEDVDYILKATNSMFPKANLRSSQIESTWSGLRPLIYEDGKSPSELSRKDEIFESESGLLSIAGGKLTGYRKMAERIVDRVINNLDLKNTDGSKTAQLPLFACDFDSNKDVQNLIINLTSENKSFNFSVDQIKEWVYRYGTHTGEVIENYKKLAASDNKDELKLILAELNYCIKNESVVSLSDFFIRRTGMLYFNLPKLKQHLDDVAAYYASRVNFLNTNQIEEQVNELRHHIDSALNF